jgi:hypothetical protein
MANTSIRPFKRYIVPLTDQIRRAPLRRNGANPRIILERRQVAALGAGRHISPQCNIDWRPSMCRHQAVTNAGYEVV